MEGGFDLTRTWAIVPLRGLTTAKTRLGASLDPVERRHLVLAMAARTLSATRDARGLRGTVLVTADPAAGELAAAFGARTLVQQLPGLNAALTEARSLALGFGATATLIVPIDLPAVSAATIDQVLADVQTAHAEAARTSTGPRAGPSALTPDDMARPAPGVVAVVPDRHGIGTNVLLTSPPAIIEPAFGDASLTAHRHAAALIGALFVQLRGPLVVDIDTGDDLVAARPADPGDMGHPAVNRERRAP